MDNDVRWVIERRLQELDYILADLRELKGDVAGHSFSFVLDDLQNAVNGLAEVLRE